MIPFEYDQSICRQLKGHDPDKENDIKNLLLGTIRRLN